MQIHPERAVETFLGISDEYDKVFLQPLLYILTTIILDLHVS